MMASRASAQWVCATAPAPLSSCARRRRGPFCSAGKTRTHSMLQYVREARRELKVDPTFGAIPIRERKRKCR